MEKIIAHKEAGFNSKGVKAGWQNDHCRQLLQKELPERHLFEFHGSSIIEENLRSGFGCEQSDKRFVDPHPWRKMCSRQSSDNI